MENNNENLDIEEGSEELAAEAAVEESPAAEETTDEVSENEDNEPEEALDESDDPEASDDPEDVEEDKGSEPEDSTEDGLPEEEPASESEDVESEESPEEELDGAEENTSDEEAAEEAEGSDDESSEVEDEGETGIVTEDNAPAEEKTPKSKKPIAIACGVVAGALVAAYAGGAIYFSGHFMPNTTLNGEDVSGMTATEVAAGIDDRVSKMAPSIKGQGLNVEYKNSDIKLEVNSASYAKSALQQEDSLAWPMEVFEAHELTSNFPVTYSKSSLTKIIHSAVEAVNKGGKEPSNAYAAYDKKEKKYVVKKGDIGTLVDEQSVITATDAQLQSLSGAVELTEENLKQPQITVDNEKLNKAVEEANDYITNEIIFKNSGNEIYKLGPKIMKEWVTISEDNDVTFNEEVARTWLDNDLKSKVNSAGSDRVYKNEVGKKVKVSGGTYGWTFELEGVTDKVIKKIKEKEGGNIKLKALTKGAVWNPGGKDWEGKYIDIDLGDQYARLFDENGKVLWESDIVSGNTSAGNGTPTGVYVINDTMARNVTLVSSQVDEKGKPTYESPVSYWMPFVENSVGLHDASWRGEFGGGIYTYNGSHGCVNLPTWTAGKLYEQIEPGIVVSCHY